MTQYKYDHVIEIWRQIKILVQRLRTGSIEKAERCNGEDREREKKKIFAQK